MSYDRQAGGSSPSFAYQAKQLSLIQITVICFGVQLVNCCADTEVSGELFELLGDASFDFVQLLVNNRRSIIVATTPGAGGVQVTTMFRI